MAHLATIIEVQHQSVGVVVRDDRKPHYRFFAAHPQFFALEGQLFGSAERAQRAARQLAAERLRKASSRALISSALS